MQITRKTLPPLVALLPFEATARLGSVTKAAAELGLTQAAVSKQVRLLEDDLGTALFERRNRAVHLTDDGRAFGRIVSDALMSISANATELRQRHRGADIVLRSQLCEGLYWLMPRLAGFYEQHPKIPIRVSVSTEPITEATERFDLALQTTGRDSGTAVAAFTASDDVFPVCSPAYLGGKRVPLSLKRLSTLRLLHHKIHPQDWVSWDDWLTRLGQDIHVQERGAVYDSYPMMMQAVLEGHGVALGWRRTVEHYLNDGTLIRPFTEHLSLPDGLTVYRPAGKRMRKGVSVLLNWLRAEFSRES
ncbi:MAG: LysR substrate-binding domain-containing protein [Geminicoccaceae bacterium]